MQRNNMSSQPINHTWTRLGYDKLGRVAKDDILKLISSHNTDGEYVPYPGLQPWNSWLCRDYVYHTTSTFTILTTADYCAQIRFISVYSVQIIFRLVLESHRIPDEIQLVFVTISSNWWYWPLLMGWGYSELIKSISFVSSRHQLKCHWLCQIDRSVSSTR